MAITDKLSQGSSSNTGRPVVASLSAPGHSIGGTSITINSATNWPTTTVIYFTMYTTVVVGTLTVKDTTSQTDWKGTLSGTTISNMTIVGGTDRDYAAGSIVELTPVARAWKDLYDWGIAQHKQDGTHANTITTDTINENTAANGVTIDGLNIKDNLVVGASGKGVDNSSLNTAAGKLGAAWQDWTPTYASITVGNGTVIAKYIQIGKTVFFDWQLTCGSTTSITNDHTITIPVTAASRYNNAGSIASIGTIQVNDVSAGTRFGGFFCLQASTTLGVSRWVRADSATSAETSSTFPVTEATGDVYCIQGMYEAA